MKKIITRDDIAFIMELKSEGVPMRFSAYYIYGLSVSALRYHLEKHGVWGR